MQKNIKKQLLKNMHFLEIYKFCTPNHRLPIAIFC